MYLCMYTKTCAWWGRVSIQETNVSRQKGHHKEMRDGRSTHSNPLGGHSVGNTYYGEADRTKCTRLQWTQNCFLFLVVDVLDDLLYLLNLPFWWSAKRLSRVALRPSQPLTSINQTRNDRYRWFTPLPYPLAPSSPFSPLPPPAIRCWFMVYCSSSHFKVAANAGQTRPRGASFSVPAREPVTWLWLSSQLLVPTKRPGVPLSLPLAPWFTDYTLRCDKNR